MDNGNFEPNNKEIFNFLVKKLGIYFLYAAMQGEVESNTQLGHTAITLRASIKTVSNHESKLGGGCKCEHEEKVQCTHAQNGFYCILISLPVLK